MNKDKINETANLVGLDESQIMSSKFSVKMKRIIYTFTQIGIFGLNAILGFVLGKSIHKYGFESYPHQIIPKTYYLTPLLVIGIGAGDTLISIKYSKKIALEKTLIVVFSLITTLLSIVSFYLIFKHIGEVNETFLTSNTFYGVYVKDFDDE
jgi:hypothetical protein